MIKSTKSKKILFTFALCALFDDFRHGAGADGVPAFANREPQALLQSDGVISDTSQLTLSPGITISTPVGSFTSPVTSVVRNKTAAGSP